MRLHVHVLFRWVKWNEFTILSLTGSCPDESPSQETQTTDLTSFMNEMGSEVLDMFTDMVSREGGINAFIKMISSGIAAKEN